MILRLFLSLLTGLILLFPVTDADLGWHLRYGDHFWSTGSILRINQFSWSLPDYLWSNHSWGYDLLVSLLFRLGSFPLLSLFGSILIAGAVYFQLPPKPKLLPFLLALIPFTFFNLELLNTGLKSGYVSLLFFSLIYTLLSSSRPQNQKIIVFLFFLWANLHGQFMVGLGLAGLYLFFQPRRRPYPFFVFGLMFLVTLINPFGLNLWHTAFAHLNAPTLKYIYEWMPWEFNSPRFLLLCLYFLFFWYLVLKSKIKYPKSSIIVLLAVTFFALKSRRMISIALLYMLPPTYALFQSRLPILKFNLKPVLSVSILVFSFFVLSSSRSIFSQSWATYCQSYLACSEGLITFLTNTHLQGKIFNSYREGGHLIYRYPSLKVFIDGRMTVWQAPDQSYVYETYLKIIQAQANSLVWLYQQNIQYVILNREYPLHSLLTQSGWPSIYSDPTLSVFANPTRKVSPSTP